MDSQAVSVGIQHAHAAGKSRGFSQGAVSFGAVGILALIGVVAFLNHKAVTDKQNAVYNAESRAFSHGVSTAHTEIAQARAQNSKAVVI